MANKMNSTKVVTGVVRLSYANVWEPASINGSNPKYSVSLIIPKSDKQPPDAINAAVDAAIKEGVAKFGGKIPNKAALKLPLRDGDTERDDEAYKNSFFVNANSTTGIKYVNANSALTIRVATKNGCPMEMAPMMMFALLVNPTKNGKPATAREASVKQVMVTGICRPIPIISLMFFR